MRGQRAHDACRPHVPEEYGFVVGAGHEHVAFGREGQGVDVVAVAEKGGRVGFALLLGEGSLLAPGFGIVVEVGIRRTGDLL